jgi:DNA polymerase I-like protein with 3'-5' exonuclease and polymerase domains
VAAEGKGRVGAQEPLPEGRPRARARHQAGGQEEIPERKGLDLGLTDEHLEYAAGDVLYLKALADKLLTLIDERGVAEAWELEQGAKPQFLDMCNRGIPFDKARWDGLTDELEQEVASLKEAADELAPVHPKGLRWNWNSPSQAIRGVLARRGRGPKPPARDPLQVRRPSDRGSRNVP